MARTTYLGSGPLGAAAASLVEAADPARAGRGDPAAFLAGLMDLRGSVELAQRLPGWEKPLPAGRVDPAGALRLRALMKDRLGEVRGAIDRVYAAPFQRRNKLPTPADLHATLAPARSSGRPLGPAIELCWAPFAALVSGAMDRARFEVQVLREEIAPPLRALGPATSRLERLDAALLGATAKGRQQVFDQLVGRLGRSFAHGLRAAVKELGEPIAIAQVEPWFLADGFISNEIEAGRRVVLAAFEHEKGRLEALIDSACPGRRG